MKKPAIIFSSIITCFIGALLLCPLVIGIIAQQETKNYIQKNIDKSVQVHVVSYDRGWFSSKVQYAITLDNNSNTPVTFQLNGIIQHGPFVSVRDLKNQMTWHLAWAAGSFDVHYPNQFGDVSIVDNSSNTSRFVTVISLNGKFHSYVKQSPMEFLLPIGELDVGSEKLKTIGYGDNSGFHFTKINANLSQLEIQKIVGENGNKVTPVSLKGIKLNCQNSSPYNGLCNFSAKKIFFAPAPTPNAMLLFRHLNLSIKKVSEKIKGSDQENVFLTLSVKKIENMAFYHFFNATSLNAKLQIGPYPIDTLKTLEKLLKQMHQSGKASKAVQDKLADSFFNTIFKSPIQFNIQQILIPSQYGPISFSGETIIPAVKSNSGQPLPGKEISQQQLKTWDIQGRLSIPRTWLENKLMLHYTIAYVARVHSAVIHAETEMLEGVTPSEKSLPKQETPSTIKQSVNQKISQWIQDGLLAQQGNQLIVNVKINHSHVLFNNKDVTKEF